MTKAIRNIFAILVVVVLLLSAKTTAKAESNCRIESESISKGTFCTDAGILQTMLNRLLDINEIVDGAINNTTVRNLIEFQEMNGLEPTGQADKETISMLNQRYYEIERQPKVIVISSEPVDVKEGPDENYSSIGEIENGRVCVLLKWTRSWAQIKCGTEIGWIKSNLLRSTFIKIDIEKQSILFIKECKEIAYAPVITGCEFQGWDTPKGNYEVSYLEGNCFITDSTHVNFWMKISKSLNVGIHDANGWRVQYGGTIYKSNGSHGCINTPDSAARKIYAEIELGMTIVIQ